jgi:hypothetical protein
MTTKKKGARAPRPRPRNYYYVATPPPVEGNMASVTIDVDAVLLPSEKDGARRLVLCGYERRGATRQRKGFAIHGVDAVTLDHATVLQIMRTPVVLVRASEHTWKLDPPTLFNTKPL